MATFGVGSPARLESASAASAAGSVETWRTSADGREGPGPQTGPAATVGDRCPRVTAASVTAKLPRPKEIGIHLSRMLVPKERASPNRGSASYESNWEYPSVPARDQPLY